MVKATPIYQVDNNFNENSEYPIQNNVVTEKLKDINNDISYLLNSINNKPEIKRVQKVIIPASSVTTYKQEFLFKIKNNGEVTLGLDVSLSRFVTVTFILDGKEIRKFDTTSGSHILQTICYGLEKGIHSFVVNIKGSTFNLTSGIISVSGYVDIEENDLFVESFLDNKGFVKREFSKVEVYSFNGEESSLVLTLNGIFKCRTAMVDDLKFITAITETGVAQVIDVQNLTSTNIYSIPIKTDARSIAGVQIFEGILELFVADNNNITHYRFNPYTYEIISFGESLSTSDDISVCVLDNEVYLFSESGGYIIINQSLSMPYNPPSDRFTINIIKEV